MCTSGIWSLYFWNPEFILLKSVVCTSGIRSLYFWNPEFVLLESGVCTSGIRSLYFRNLKFVLSESEVCTSESEVCSSGFVPLLIFFYFNLIHNSNRENGGKSVPGSLINL